MAKKLKVTQIRSSIGNKIKAKRTIEALGIKRMHDTVVHADRPEIRGMIFRVKHMLRVEEIEE